MGSPLVILEIILLCFLLLYYKQPLITHFFIAIRLKNTQLADSTFFCFLFTIFIFQLIQSSQTKTPQFFEEFLFVVYFNECLLFTGRLIQQP